jgi:tRNA (cmo5U34)-methyltransferase
VQNHNPSNRVKEEKEEEADDDDDQAVKEWSSIQQVSFYLKKAANLPQRTEGEAILFDLIPKDVKRVIDLGTGDGHLLKLLKRQIPHIKAIAVDVSSIMLDAARKNFANDPDVEVIEHNLSNPLPDMGQFDAVISSFVIHHLAHERKRSLYEEIYDILNSGGIFCNLEHVASVSQKQHIHFFNAIGHSIESEDKSDKLLSMEEQLKWLKEIGFVDVDCYWKWLEMTLLVGYKT